MVAFARSIASIVIHGETGSGKEILSRALHELSGRPGPLLEINCAALAPQLLELVHERRGARGLCRQPNQAARRLGISRATLVHELDIYRVPRPRRK